MGAREKSENGPAYIILSVRPFSEIDDYLLPLALDRCECGLAGAAPAAGDEPTGLPSPVPEEALDGGGGSLLAEAPTNSMYAWA